MRKSKADFIRQLGFPDADAAEGLYAGLMFQPRVIAGVLLLGASLQTPWIFIVLSAMLWWSALVPTHNPFDAFFNRVVADGTRFLVVPPAREPRRFATAMAGMISATIAATLLAGVSTAAWLLEGLFAFALLEVVGARFCRGAYVYQRLCSRVSPRRCPSPHQTELRQG